MWNSIPHIEDLITFKTNYQPTLKENVEITYPRDGDRYKFTEIQRKCASRAVVPLNLADFEEKVGCSNFQVFFFFRWETHCVHLQLRKQLLSGKRERKTQYLHLDVDFLDG